MSDMPSGKDIGKAIKSACQETEGLGNLRSGGNLGMAFIAYAICDHANAIRELAEAIKDEESYI